jgi:hypothetical protein
MEDIGDPRIAQSLLGFLKIQTGFAAVALLFNRFHNRNMR